MSNKNPFLVSSGDDNDPSIIGRDFLALVRHSLEYYSGPKVSEADIIRTVTKYSGLKQEPYEQLLNDHRAVLSTFGVNDENK